jgi:hypothetical protein
MFTYLQDSVICRFEHPVWDSFESFELANKANLNPEQIKMWIIETSDKTFKNKKIQINHVEKFLIQKGIDSCLSEFNNYSCRAPVSPPRKRINNVKNLINF